jgi:hypothetical protein
MKGLFHPRSSPFVSFRGLFGPPLASRTMPVDVVDLERALAHESGGIDVAHALEATGLPTARDRQSRGAR